MAWRRFFRRRYWDGERAREIEQYLEFETAENLARGMTQEEAQYAARRKLGNPTLIREEIYHMNSLGWAEALWRDVRYGMRGLWLSPGFATVAVLSLALGIGANAAIFQLFDAVRLKLLPVRDPGQLAEVMIPTQTGKGNHIGRRPHLTYAIWQEIERQQQVFSGMAAWMDVSFNLAPTGEERPAQGLFVSGDFFGTLGVQPILGRLIQRQDDQRGCGAPGAVVSYQFWQTELGGDASPVGRKITLNGHPFPVIGVTPASFFGMDVGHQFEIAVPLCSEPVVEPDRISVDRRTYWWLAAIGRLKPGVTLRQADAAMKALAPEIFRAALPPDLPPDDAKQFLGYRLEAVGAGSGFSSVGRRYADPLMLALSIAGLVLLIACANLANLMLARASVRKREIAVRMALGARRGRVVAQLLVEGMLLAMIGAAAGVLLAQILSRALVAFLNTGTAEQVSLSTSLDWRVFGFTAGLAILTCVLFGLAPALRATSMGPSAVMKASGRGMSDGLERFGLRRFLVISQVALSLVLLSGALLFVRSLTNLLTMDAGFRQEGVLRIDLDMRDRRLSRESQQLFNQHVLERLRSIPGVSGAASMAIAPATDDWWSERVGLDGTENRWEMVNVDRVGEGFFRTLGIGKVAGREFDRHDTPETAKVVIVNEAFARTIAGSENPIGRRLRIQTNPGQPEPWYEIVGLVRDTKYGTLRDPFGPIVYLAESQTTDTIAGPKFLLRSDLGLAAVTPAVRRVIHNIDPTVSVSYAVFRKDVRQVLLPERLMAMIAASFGLLAAVLATTGLYGVVAYLAARRRNEIGIRMALGADRLAVMAMVLREAGTLLMVGLAAGLVLTLAAGRLASSLLYGVAPWDPLSLGVAFSALAGIGFMAAFIPAHRAARLDPMAALREE